MTRIISGAAGGLRLQSPPGATTRPTSDRVREAMFSRLGHEGLLDATRVLDLYAGSGALGLEALSRGARSAVWVEQSQAAARAIRRNLAATRLGAGEVVTDRVERYLARPGAGEPFDLVLADPPYPLGEDELAAVLHQLAQGHWLSAQAVVVVERSDRSPEPRWPTAAGPTGPDSTVPGATASGSTALDRYDDRRYGETRLWFAERV